MEVLKKPSFLVYIASSAGRIAALDGLRALAIILVLFRHGATSLQYSYPVIYKEVINEQFSNWMLNGWVGVDLFFVLSGFLVGYHLINSWGRGNNSRLVFFGKYWLKRILRTFPLYYVVLLIVILNIIPLYEHSSVNIKGEFLKHALFLQDYYGTRLLAPLWSLATEEKFYLMCPMLLWVITKLHNMSKSLTLVTLVVLSAVPLALRLYSYDSGSNVDYPMFFWSYRAPFHLALDGLLMGLVVAYVYSFDLLNDKIRKFGNGAFLLASLIALIIMGSYSWMSDTSNWVLTIFILFFMPVLFSILVYFSIYSSGFVDKVLSSVVLRFFSRISYSLYLVHMLVIPMSLWFFNEFLINAFPMELALLIYFLIYLLMSISLSIILHLLVEKPFLILKGKVSY